MIRAIYILTNRYGSYQDIPTLNKSQSLGALSADSDPGPSRQKVFVDMSKRPPASPPQEIVYANEESSGQKEALYAKINRGDLQSKVCFFNICSSLLKQDFVSFQ